MEELREKGRCPDVVYEKDRMKWTTKERGRVNHPNEAKGENFAGSRFIRKAGPSLDPPLLAVPRPHTPLRILS